MIRYKKYDNGFKYLEIQNSMAEAKIALQGAHIFYYKAINQPSLLWLSKCANFQEGKAIRGGIPLCFPWFGKHKKDNTLPQHGFARTALWEVVKENEMEDGSTHIRLQLSKSPETFAVWAYVFEVNLDIYVGETLILKMHVSNKDTRAFEVGTALHTYFNVTDVSEVLIEGLENMHYYDVLTKCMKIQTKTLKIDREVDRVYQTKSQSIKLINNHSYIDIRARGSASVVVWNPWKEKSVAMADMRDDGYKTMLCIETCNALEDTRTIQPNELHSVTVEYTQVT